MKNRRLYDLIIIGGGPAGVAAGIYGARQKMDALLITKNFGGQLARKAINIENYPGFSEISGLELTGRLEKHLRKNKIDIERDEVKKVSRNHNKFLVETVSKNIFQARAVIVASGGDPRPLEIKGEKEFLGRGVSYCTLCDAPLFSKKTVAVIGGGNAGFEAALALAKWARQVYILEYGDKPAADPENQAQVKKVKKIKIILRAAPKEFQGKKFVESLRYLDKKKAREIDLKVDGVFIEIGNQPATSFVKGLVEFNEKDEIKIDPFSGQTSCPGLFAAGDADNLPFKQIVIAAGEGAKAAIAAYAYLQKKK